MLHIINKSPFEKNTLESCLRLAQPGACVLFIEDGVFGALKDTWITSSLVDYFDRLSFYVLEPDLQARGIDISDLSRQIHVVDYDGFVTLAVESNAVQSWL